MRNGGQTCSGQTQHMIRLRRLVSRFGRGQIFLLLEMNNGM